MPKLLLMQDVKDRRNIRVVVDGQQRLRAILEYVEGGFAISRAHSREHAGVRFDDLPGEIQSDLLKYEIGVDLLYDLPYGDLLDIFARLNTYTGKLSYCICTSSVSATHARNLRFACNVSRQ